MIRRDFGVVVGLTMLASVFTAVVVAAEATQPAEKPTDKPAKTQPAEKPAEKPAKTQFQLDTPEEALKTYVTAWKNMEFRSIMACVVPVANRDKQQQVERLVNYYMWQLALERACVAKFGKEEGLRVLGHVRALDEQYALDLKRAGNPNIDYDADKSHAHVFLKREKDRPDELQTDEFNFRDDYWLAKDNGFWKVDFLKTYGYEGAEKEKELRYKATVYPTIATAMKDLTEKVRKGEITSADAVKSAITAAWDKTDTTAVPKDE